MSGKELIDKYFGKAISKTFLVFIIGTIGLFGTHLSGTEWTIIASVYIGSHKVTETILKLKNRI